MTGRRRVPTPHDRFGALPYEPERFYGQKPIYRYDEDDGAWWLVSSPWRLIETPHGGRVPIPLCSRWWPGIGARVLPLGYMPAVRSL